MVVTAAGARDEGTAGASATGASGPALADLIERVAGAETDAVGAASAAASATGVAGAVDSDLADRLAGANAAVFGVEA
jgi:hypothetical protein